MTAQEEFRAISAEAIAIAFVMAMDEDARIVGVTHEELKTRALLKLQMHPALKYSLTLAIDRIEEACREYADSRIAQLLQPGMETMSLDGRKVKVEMSDSFLDAELRVTNILTGAGLDVSDGAFVIFIDSRCAKTEALRRWEKITEGDSSVMIIPLEVPKGSSVEQVVAAKRQTEAGFAE